MADFDAQVRESQEQVAAAQAKISELTSRIETARAKMKSGDDIALDIENATLEDVHAHTEVMNANIAELIMGLDDVTAGFSKDFEEMRSKTGWESFVGMFSSAKSESMRQERMRTASVDDKLQDLISKSNTIQKLLETQLAVLNEQKTKVEANLVSTLDEREATVGELEAARADILAMDPKIIELEGKISMEQDAAKRTKLESELAAAAVAPQVGGVVAPEGHHDAHGFDQRDPPPGLFAQQGHGSSGCRGGEPDGQVHGGVGYHDYHCPAFGNPWNRYGYNRLL